VERLHESKVERTEEEGTFQREGPIEAKDRESRCYLNTQLYCTRCIYVYVVSELKRTKEAL